MYAIKKHINKVLAAFLCACLLLSYNPAFGTATNAWALDGDPADSQPALDGLYATDGSSLNPEVGDPVSVRGSEDGNPVINKDADGASTGASTLVEARTFTSSLQVEATEGPLYATKQEIIDYKKDNGKPYELIVKATSSQSNEARDYTFTWKVYQGSTKTLMSDEAQALVNSVRMPSVSDHPSFETGSNNVFYQALDLSRLFESDTNNLFTDDQQYCFECEVTLVVGGKTIASDDPNKNPAQIDLYTVSEKDRPGYGLDYLTKNGVVASTIGHEDEDSGFLSSADLTTGFPTDEIKNSIQNDFDRYAYYNPETNSLTGETGAKHETGEAYMININGELDLDKKYPGAEGPYDIYLPLDSEWCKSDANPWGYELGDEIDVLWRVTGLNETNWQNTLPIKTEVVKDPKYPDSGVLFAKVTYNNPPSSGGATPSCSGEGDNATTQVANGSYQDLPGCFAISYSTKHRNPKDDESYYYTVNTVVKDDTGGALVGSSEDGKYFFGNAATIRITPDTNDARYELTHLWFQVGDDADNKQDLVALLAADKLPAGLTLDPALSCVIFVKDGPLASAPFAEYTLTAEFASMGSTAIPSETNKWWRLNLSVAADDTFAQNVDGVYNKSDAALIRANYQTTAENNTKVVTATADTLNDNPKIVDVVKGGMVNMDFIVHSGLNEIDWYQVTSVWSSTDGLHWTKSKTGYSLAVPNMTSDLYVRIVVEEANAPLDADRTYHKVTVEKTAESPDDCFISPESGYVAVSDLGLTTPSGMTITTRGTSSPTGGFYAKTAYIYEGDDAIAKNEVTREVNLDDDPEYPTKYTGEKSWTYIPTNLDGITSFKGDIKIVIDFVTTNPTPRQLTVNVSGGNGVATLVNGGLLNDEGVATVNSGDRFALLMVPDSGYEISSVRVVLASSGLDYRPTSKNYGDYYDPTIAVSGVYSEVMWDENATITVVFKPVSALSTPQAQSQPRTLSVYVADPSLKTNDAVKYIWNDIKDAAISVDDVNNNWGVVNSATAIENTTLPMGDSYVLNFKGYETDALHAVSKVLVVPYDIEGEGDAAHKVARSDWKVYDWSAPTFELNYATWNTWPRVDVIVYFDEVDEKAGETVNQPSKYVEVVVTDDNGYLKEGFEPSGRIEVLPGGYVTITDMELNEDLWVWDDKNPPTVNGTPLSKEEFDKLKKTGVLELGPVNPPADGKPYEVVINAAKKPEDTTPKTFQVFAEDPTKPTAQLNGWVYVTPEGETSQEARWDEPAVVDNGTPFTVGFRAMDDFELTQVKFDVSNWYPERDTWPLAWYKLIPAEGEGTYSYHSLIFQTEDEYKTNGKPGGYAAYTGGVISITDESPTQWHVSGLSGDLTVLPTFSAVKEFEDPNNNAWKVQTRILNGKGSVTMTYNGVGYGNQVNVRKGSELPVTIQIAAASGYKLKKVVSKTQSDNPLVNIWNGITGQGTTNVTQSVTASGGSLVISPVTLDYLIEIEFENTDTSKLDTETIPVNVYSDTNKGTVKPNTNVRAKRDGVPQFEIDVKSVLDDKNQPKWYSIESVNVTPHFTDSEGVVTTGNTQVVKPDNTTSSYVKWLYENNVVFTVDIAAVGNSRTDLSAVDVEVVYGAPNLSSKPESGVDPNGKKKVTITATTGGLVAPLGEFDVYPYKVGADWAEVLAVVTPLTGYGLKSLTVQTNEGTAESPSYVSNPTLAEKYMEQIRGDNASSSRCFYIKANPDPGYSDTMKDEKIHVVFDRLSVAESTYTIHVKEVKKATGVSGTVVTTKDVTLPTNQSFSYCVNTTGSNTAVKVKDEYRVGTGDDAAYFDVPASAATGEGKTAIQRDATNNTVLVNPAAIRGQVVDRWLTFEFVAATGPDDPDKVTPIPTDKKANIKILIHSDDGSKAALVFSPKANLNNIVVSDLSNYTYNWYFPESANKNYYVYCVKVNGELYAGSEVPTKGKMFRDGYFTFESGNLPINLKAGETNTLDIYTGTFVGGEPPVIGGAGGRFEVEAGEGGWILDNDGNYASVGKLGSNLFAPSGDWMASYASLAGFELDEVARYGEDEPSTETGEDGEDDDFLSGGNATDNKNKVETYTIVPAPGYVIDHVYLYQCHILNADSWAWLTPSSIPSLARYKTAFGESWTKEIVLQYTLELDHSGEDAVGYMYTSYKYVGTDKITDMPWSPTDEDRHSKLGSDNLEIEFYPANYAEAIAEYISSEQTPVRYLHQGTKAQDGTIAAFGHTEAKSGNSYLVKFSTFDVIDEEEPYTFLIGPLLPEDGDLNAADKLYTIKQDELKKKMPNVEIEPYIEAGAAAQLATVEDEDENEGIDTQADDKPNFYRYYTVSGKASDLNLSNDAKSLYMQMPLDKLTVNSGNFPELPSLDKTVNENTTYELAAYVDGEGGSITPTSTSSVAAWNDGDDEGPWTVARGTTVAFKVEADEGFVLTSLKRNGLQRLNAASREYNASTSTFVFSVFADTEVVAEFTPDTDENASRTVTIAVQGGHGTTSPTPGIYPVQKGQPYSITFVPESGYVPYRIWVDGVESFAGPTWVGYTLPASWSNQTFTVQYAVAGTTPTTGQQLVQTGQNVLNDAATGLVRTGDNPVAIACIVGVAVLAAVGVWQMRRRKATAARAAKYSVTKRRM